MLGWSPKDDREILPLEEIIERFDFPGINKSNASFDLTKLQWLNGQVFMDLDAQALWEHTEPVLQQASLDIDEALLREIVPLLQTKVSLASNLWRN